MKKFNVFIDTNAEDDLFDIYSYVALNDSIERADKIFTALRSTCFKLRTLPLRGNVPTELFEIGVTEFREIHNSPYRIIYSIASTSVYIHCVLDGRRDVQTILQERLLR
ncbi:MAG: type II toxin-antitoxin system RelE/ParE family toxin [Bacteroidota bacterium]|jgi:toxin ParE1/3/4